MQPFLHAIWQIVLYNDNLDLDIAWPPLNPDIIRKAHAHGHKFNIWNVDDPADAEKFISWGVDYITTNFLE